LTLTVLPFRQHIKADLKPLLCKISEVIVHSNDPYLHRKHAGLRSRLTAKLSRHPQFEIVQPYLRLDDL
jgi:hypothetical protein